MSIDQDTSDCQAHMKVYKDVTPLWEVYVYAQNQNSKNDTS